MILHNTDLQSINNCTVLQGSLYLQAQWNANAVTLPPSLHTITGGLICNGTGSNPSTNMIVAQSLTLIASNDSSPAAGLGFLVTDYSNITKLSFPKLASISSSFLVAGNPRLSVIDGFQSLAQVSGNLNIMGDFYSLDLPSLKSVSGNVDVETSADNFTCPISSQIQNSVTGSGGSFVCAGNIKQASPTTSVGTSSALPSSNSPSSTSSSSASSSGWTQSDVKILNLSKFNDENKLIEDFPVSLIILSIWFIILSIQ